MVDLSRPDRKISTIKVWAHPTALLLNETRTRLFVANSNDDSVSVIDTTTDREIEPINVRLAANELTGNTPEGLALEGHTLYVANAHSNSVAVVQLSKKAEGGIYFRQEKTDTEKHEDERSKVNGFIPTGRYPSALAFVDRTSLLGMAKGLVWKTLQ